MIILNYMTRILFFANRGRHTIYALMTCVQTCALPILASLRVLTPTRELATQSADNAREYAKFSRLSVATVFGGTSINKNRQDMSRGVDLLVATPGRLIDLIEQRYVNLSMLEILVLDEIGRAHV